MGQPRYSGLSARSSAPTRLLLPREEPTRREVLRVEAVALGLAEKAYERGLEFARRAAESLGVPSLFVSSNSELELLPRDSARQKVLRLGEISARLKEQLR